MKEKNTKKYDCEKMRERENKLNWFSFFVDVVNWNGIPYILDTHIDSTNIDALLPPNEHR